MISKNGFDLDAQLEQQLHRQLGTLSGPSPQVFQSAYHAAFLKASGRGLVSSLVFAASSRAVAGLAVAAFAVGGGSLVAAAATGSSNPVVWGRTVTTAVQTCKDARNRTHGIGECVSRVAQQQGAEERAAHSHGNSEQDHPTAPSSSTSNGHGHGRANGRSPGSSPGATPSGPENNHLTGPPATPPDQPK